MTEARRNRRPNVLFVMTDQQRFDTISSLGNAHIHTPNLDRLVARGAAFTNSYSTTPVCIPARYTIRTGCELPTFSDLMWTKDGINFKMNCGIRERCGPYIAERMNQLGYRTFGIGKFHTLPWDGPVGFEVQLHSEELDAGDLEQRKRDSYISFLSENHPEYSWLEAVHGERTEMYYMPQRRPLPASITVESWAAAQATQLINVDDDRPWFGFVSFIGPHPPFAPPQPFNRLYDPDRMPNPVRGDIAVDHMDQYLPMMNHMIWADSINDDHARILKARYYGEITYIDECIGQILDTVEARDDAANTVICFFSDHGEHLGDHNSWQKESFFEASARVPFLVSWPDRIPVGNRSELVCLTDLFGIATSAAGEPDLREGADVLGLLIHGKEPRETLFGYHYQPGTWKFKFMVRRDHWKLIYLANGGLTQLFDVESDPFELHELSKEQPEVTASLLKIGANELARRNCCDALDRDGNPIALQFRDWKQETLVSRVYQFDPLSSQTRFPQDPGSIVT